MFIICIQTGLIFVLGSTHQRIHKLRMASFCHSSSDWVQRMEESTR
jgi:hypothetical protein